MVLLSIQLIEGCKKMNRMIAIFFMVAIFVASLDAKSGKKVFETYCWGCHHQTAVAFGPPFSEIASHRTAEEIQAMITDPSSVSKIFGYKRNAMPAFSLKAEELKAITDYILSFKEKPAMKKDKGKEVNATEVKEPYPGIATNKETK